MANKARGVWIVSVGLALVIVAAAAVVRQAAADLARQRAQAEVALLGRWDLTPPAPVGVTLLLDFHVGETGRYRCSYPGGGGGGRIVFTVRQETLRRRALDIVQRRPVPAAVYMFRASPAPPRAVLGRFGAAWHGLLLGDGNVLVFYAPRPHLSRCGGRGRDEGRQRAQGAVKSEPPRVSDRRERVCHGRKATTTAARNTGEERQGQPS